MTRKIWDHVIDLKKEFVLKKEKIYLLSKEEREEMHNFISEQLRKGYIRSLELPQNSTSVFCKEEEWKEKNGTRLLISQ